MSASKGFSPLIIIAVVAVVGALGFFLFKSGGLGGMGSPQSLNIASEKDFEFITDATLRKHFVAQSNVARYRSRASSTGKGELIDINEYDVASGAFRWTQEKLGKEVAHLISIDDATYVKDYSDGKWWKEIVKPEEVDETVPDEPEDFKSTFSKEDPSLYKNLGTEACGDSAPGLTCHKYEQTFKDAPGKRSFWFDTKNFLLRKDMSGYGEFTAEVLYTYDNINIKAPSPTKGVPEGKNIYDYFNQVVPTPLAPSNVTMPTVPPTGGEEIPQELPSDLPTDIGY